MRGGLFFRGAGQGRARVKIRGAGRGGANVKIHGAGRGEIARKSTNSPNFTKCVIEKYNITYYKTNYKITHNIIILAENKYCIRNRDNDQPILIIILE